MTRLEELQVKFLGIPLTVVTKADVFREGVQPGPELLKIARWATPQTHNVYEYDHEEAREQHESREGYFLIPAAFNFRDGTAVLLKLDSGSPYAIRKCRINARDHDFERIDDGRASGTTPGRGVAAPRSA